MRLLRVELNLALFHDLKSLPLVHVRDLSIILPES